MKQRTKPTRNEIKTVLNNLLIEVSQMSSFIKGLDASFAAYLEMKGDAKELGEYITNKIQEAKDAKQEQSEGK